MNVDEENEANPNPAPPGALLNAVHSTGSHLSSIFSSTTLTTSTEEKTKSIIFSGNVLRMGFLNTWSMRWVELYHDHMAIYSMKGGLRFGTYELNPNILAEDSLEREYCFKLKDSSGQMVHFATTNMATKDLWMEHIQGVLTVLRKEFILKKSGRSQSEKEVLAQVAEAAFLYSSRPQIHMKVIQAKNLLDKISGDSSAHVQIAPFVKITIGSSTMRTTTRKNCKGDTDWGMVFSFDWDRSMRFARVEVWDEERGIDEFIG